MFLAKEEIKLRALSRNPVARLLFLNALFVIVGYALANSTGGGSIGIVRVFKNIFLFISLVYLIVTNKVTNPGHFFDRGFVPIIFGILVFYVSIGASEFGQTFNQISTFFIPFIYIYLSLSYLISNFGIQILLKGLHYSLLIIYCIPLISYIFSGGKISQTNIYGSGGDGQLFASNNYGWSATLYILSFLFVWKDIKLKKISKILFGVFLPIAIILFFTSANRASWLSMSVVMIPFFFSYKAMHLKYKVALILLVLGFISILLAIPDSSINYARNKSQMQENKGEERFRIAEMMYDHIDEDPTLWITGVGFFNKEILKNKSNITGYHNSYYEILFGGGIPLFLVFLSFMFFTPLIRFIKYYYKYTLLLPALMILPFFESDISAGQFLFFPWFTFMLLLNAKTKFWNKETFKSSIQKYKITNTDIIVNETNNPVV